MKIATTASVVAMTVSVAVVPAYAMQDIAIEDTPSSFAATVDDAQNSSNSMPDNPNATLPETVSENISDDSTVVSENLAVTPEGDVQNIETGETVTDAQLVGTQSQQPDPLAKTDGESFIPVSASDVKDAVEQPVKQSAEQSSLKGGSTVRLTKFESNEYGAHWGTDNGTKAFFDYRNNLFVQQAKGVIDVSSWQGDIDWAKAKADGVEGAIIRLGYGWGNHADAKAQRNINECKRLGIPFGIYWYSYAYDANCARAEGNDVAAKLRQMGVSPNDLKYPVYYDLEKWTWAGHTPPTNPNVYSGMADAWYGALQSAGYKNLSFCNINCFLIFFDNFSYLNKRIFRLELNCKFFNIAFSCSIFFKCFHNTRTYSCHLRSVVTANDSSHKVTTESRTCHIKELSCCFRVSSLRIRLNVKSCTVSCKTCMYSCRYSWCKVTTY